MKILFKTIAIALAGAAMLTSCNKEQISETYTPAEGDGIYSFEASSVPAVEFTPSKTTAQIEVIRTNAEGAATLAVTSSQTDGENAVNVLNVPSEVTFKDGENFAFITVSINENIQENVSYSLSLSIAEKDCTPGGEPAVSLSFTYAMWESIGTGEFFDELMGDADVVVVDILQSINNPSRYRIMNPYTNDAIEAIIAFVEGGEDKKGPSDYIEFTLNDDGSVVWSGCWNNGVLYDSSNEMSSMNYYFGTQSPFNGGAALVDQCFEIKDGLIQFTPHISAFASETSGWIIAGQDGAGNAYYFKQYVSFPGAAETVSDYLEL